MSIVKKNQTETTSDTEENKWTEVYEAEKGINPRASASCATDERAKFRKVSRFGMACV
jgi:hypothetical protein